MEKKRKTYEIDFKKKVVDLHLEEGMGYNLIAKELGIDKNQVRRWVNHFNNEGMMGLEEKRGKSKGIGMGRPRTLSEDPETKIKLLQAENEMLKRLLEM